MLKILLLIEELMHVLQQLYKQLPFAGCKIALLGFKQEEEQEMVEIAIKNGVCCVYGCMLCLVNMSYA